MQDIKQCASSHEFGNNHQIRWLCTGFHKSENASCAQYCYFRLKFRYRCRVLQCVCVNLHHRNCAATVLCRLLLSKTPRSSLFTKLYPVRCHSSGCTRGFYTPTKVDASVRLAHRGLHLVWDFRGSEYFPLSNRVIRRFGQFVQSSHKFPSMLSVFWSILLPSCNFRLADNKDVSMSFGFLAGTFGA